MVPSTFSTSILELYQLKIKHPQLMKILNILAYLSPKLAAK